MREAFDRFAEITPQHSEIFVDLSMDIALRIDRILRKKKISSKELAKKIGRKKSEVEYMMGGLHNFNLQTIAKIEAALDEKIIVVFKPEKKRRKK